MRKTGEAIFGVPVGARRVREETDRLLQVRSLPEVRAMLAENLAHMTSKAGALLQAQGIFFVVATYVLDHGWPRYPTLVAMFLLIVAALLLLSVLRSIFIGAAPAGAAGDPEFELLIRSGTVLAYRGALFNVSLYLTFLSIVLLGVGAVAIVL